MEDEEVVEKRECSVGGGLDRTSGEISSLFVVWWISFSLVAHTRFFCNYGGGREGKREERKMQKTRGLILGPSNQGPGFDVVPLFTFVTLNTFFLFYLSIYSYFLNRGIWEIGTGYPRSVCGDMFPGNPNPFLHFLQVEVQTHITVIYSFYYYLCLG